MSNKSYSIGIVTYHARFDDYFKPLITNLVKFFPDKEILCVINGHNDKTLQIEYLDKVTKFMKQFPNVRYLTYDIGQSLSKCWNQLVILSEAEKTIILSDDVYIGDYFRDQIEDVIDKHEMFLINRTFCHFVISKNTIRKIGWFDERLPRIGWEDTDYMFRFRMAETPLPSEKILGSLNLSTDTEGSDWVNDPSKPKTKYTYANEDFFKTKYLTKEYNPEIESFEYVAETDHDTFTPVKGMETPAFYDLSVLDKIVSENNSDYKQNKNLSYYLNKITFHLLDIAYRTARKTKRIIKKIKQTVLPI